MPLLVRVCLCNIGKYQLSVLILDFRYGLKFSKQSILSKNILKLSL